MNEAYLCLRVRSKSSLLTALFRLFEAEPSGCITIDGIPISEIGTLDLRTRLSIIPVLNSFLISPSFALQSCYRKLQLIHFYYTARTLPL